MVNDQCALCRGRTGASLGTKTSSMGWSCATIVTRSLYDLEPDDDNRPCHNPTAP